jgi:hypothetical protein
MPVRLDLLLASLFLALSCGSVQASAPASKEKGKAAKPAASKVAKPPANKAASARIQKATSKARLTKGPVTTNAAATSKAAAGKKGATVAKAKATKSAKAATPKSAAGSAADLEAQVMALPTPLRAQTFNLMMMTSLLAPPTLIEDVATSGRQAGNYSSGVALSKLEPLLVSAGLPAAASCVGKFGEVLKDPAKRLYEVFPKGCAGFNEVHKIAATAINPRLEGLANKWVQAALQKGLVEAKNAGFTYRARSKPVSLSDAYK